ncbi:lysophospholipid acyltransferase family protein [Mycoplasma todarodis]|uniref:1-acyl-sn-glycerol-3-phosphate acyltransferase n=1 Tax=Mycoplasma todarodis TaxID=1937191 RepID=A0A4V2NI00_9MOLU|nr:lysophospholipid acyltransferase family protein [Mycoplasma todarodis]TCG10898.1 1-acyl-sn-glycerol-3-phosphate acyltransferase [Mycoplasma todarodis]
MSLLKIKVGLLTPYWLFKGHRANRIHKKSLKDPERFSNEYKWNIAVKRAQKTLKGFNVVLDIKGYENLPKGTALLVPNHQSWIDPVCVVAALAKQTGEADVKHKKAVFLAKKEVMDKKSFRGWGRITNTFFIDRKNTRESLKQLDAMGNFAKENGDLMVIFPEGTRTKTGKLQEFKTGAFRLAKKEFVPIIPVTINNSYKGANFDRKGKTHVEVIFGKPIKPMTFMGQPNEKIAERVKAKVQKNYKEFDATEKSVREQEV